MGYKIEIDCGTKERSRLVIFANLLMARGVEFRYFAGTLYFNMDHEGLEFRLEFGEFEQAVYLYNAKVFHGNFEEFKQYLDHLLTEVKS